MTMIPSRRVRRLAAGVSAMLDRRTSGSDLRELSFPRRRGGRLAALDRANYFAAGAGSTRAAICFSISPGASGDQPWPPRQPNWIVPP